MLAAILGWTQTILFYALLVSVAMWLGCKFRVLPVIVMRIWYGVTFVVCLVHLDLALRFFLFFYPYLGWTRRECAKFCTGLAYPCFAAHAFLNPHIVIHLPRPEVIAEYKEIVDGKLQCVFLSNHTSFADQNALFAVADFKIASSFKPLYKSDLENIPLWGLFYKAAQAYPVNFQKGDEDGNFSVDKEKQAAVSERMKDDVLNHKTCPSCFPEGCINVTEAGPTKIQPLRFGMLKFALDHKLSIVLLCQNGAWRTWPPRGVAIGGFPADIFVDGCIIPYEKISRFDKVEDLAVWLRGEMQKILDRMTECAENFEKKKTK